MHVYLHSFAYNHSSRVSRSRLTQDDSWQGDFVVLASEPVCICGVDVAAPQQLRARNSQHKLSMAELRSTFSRQFTDYEVREGCSARPSLLKRGACCQSLMTRGLQQKLLCHHKQCNIAGRVLGVQMREVTRPANILLVSLDCPMTRSVFSIVDSRSGHLWMPLGLPQMQRKACSGDCGASKR